MSRYMVPLSKAANEPEPNPEPVPQHLMQHPVFGGSGQRVGLMSGENPLFGGQVHGHENLKGHLKQMGLQFEDTDGRYGMPEKSVIVHNPSREQMFELGKNFGQESVIYGESGRHELLYTNGPKQGKFNPSMPRMDFFKEPPPDYYTRLPTGGYLRLYFNDDQLLDSPLSHIQPAAAESPVEKSLTIHEALYQVYELTKSLSLGMPAPAVGHGGPHPNAYDWHDPHTDHHFRVSGQGVLICPSGVHLQPGGLAKAASLVHPHMDAAIKAPHPEQHATNDQASKAGISTYAKFAGPYGQVKPGQKSDLLHYPYHGKLPDIERLVKDHGYKTYYAGGKYGKPDLANRNYNTKHLMVYDPTPESGGDFGHEEYTKGWRQIHELSHALSYPELNQIYGEGRRIGKLGVHRSTREALRAVHWEWLAAHKQRELSKLIGVHVPDETFNKELNTVMHDAVHRASTGRFTEPSGEGYFPHAHQVPLETALGMIREEGHNLGLHGMDDTIKLRKSVGENAVSNDRDISPGAALQELAKATRELIEKHAAEIEFLHKRELAKGEGKGTCGRCGRYVDLDQHDRDKCLSSREQEGRIEDNRRNMARGKVPPVPAPPEHKKMDPTGDATGSSGPGMDPTGGMTMSDNFDKSDMTSSGALCKICKSHHPVGKCSMNKSQLGKHEYKASEKYMCKSCGEEMSADAHFEKPYKPFREPAKKSEDYIDLAHSSDPDKRIKEVPNAHAGVMPDDKTSKEISAPGSGGAIRKGKSLGKGDVPMAKPPGKAPTPAAVPQSKPAAAPKMPAMGKKEPIIPGRALFKAIPGQMGMQDQQAMVQAHTPKFSAAAPAKPTFGGAPVPKQGIQEQHADVQAASGNKFAAPAPKPAASPAHPGAPATAGLKPPSPGIKEPKPAAPGAPAGGAAAAKPGIFGRLAAKLSAPMGATPKLPGAAPAPTAKSENDNKK